MLSFITAGIILFSFLPRDGRHVKVPGILFGLLEWREKFSHEKDANRKEILLLPFAANEAIVQGQATSIVLKHGRFLDLIQDCIDNYESIFGMALLGDDHFLPTMPLCQIDHIDVLSGYRGKVTIRATLRAVSRARITKLSQMQPFMVGFCEEFMDLECSDLNRARELVNYIETTIGMARRSEYDAFGKDTLDTLCVHQVSQDDLSSVSTLTAASWACFSLLSDKRYCVDAIASDNLIDRLELGLSAILDEKFRNCQITPESNGVDFGFD